MANERSSGTAFFSAKDEKSVLAGAHDYFVNNVLPSDIKACVRKIKAPTLYVNNHDETFLLVRSGHGTLTVNGLDYRLKPDTLVNLGPFHRYRYQPDKGETLEIAESRMNSGTYVYLVANPYMKFEQFYVPSEPPVVALHGLYAEIANDAMGGHFVLAGKAPKKQAFTDAVMWDAEECKRMGIEIKTGVTVTPELIKEVKPDHVIVATGAHFVKPNIPGLDTAADVFVAEDVLAGKAMPHGETIILGGGGVGCETAQFLIEHGVTDVRVMDTKRVGNKMGMLRTMFLDIEYPGETIKKSRGSKVTAVGDHEITYAFTNKAKKTVEKTRHFDSLVIATGMHSRPTQDLTDACSELGIPCDVIGSARKADMGIEATAEAYAAAMKV